MTGEGPLQSRIDTESDELSDALLRELKSANLRPEERVAVLESMEHVRDRLRKTSAHGAEAARFVLAEADRLGGAAAGGPRAAQVLRRVAPSLLTFREHR